MSGWIRLHRGWRDCEAFADEPMSEREAWVWLIETAAWKPLVRISSKGERINVERGQLHTSLRALGTCFSWGKNKVSRFIDRLEKEKMIGTVAGQSGLLITICNYAKYQDVDADNEKAGGTATGQSRDTQEEGKEITITNVMGVPPADIVKAIFDSGLALLRNAGHDERASRSIIGRWRKQGGDGLVLQSITEATARNISNPVEWMPKRLKANGGASDLDILLDQSERYARQAA